MIFYQMKELTPISKSLHCKCFQLIWRGQVIHVLLIKAHSLVYNQIDCFALFFETNIEAAILV